MSAASEHLANITLEIDTMYDHGHVKHPDVYVAVEDVRIAAEKVDAAMKEMEAAVAKAKEAFKRDGDI